TAGCGIAHAPCRVAEPTVTAGHLVVVHLGRPQGMGEQRRVASWRAIADATGVAVSEIVLLRDHRRRRPNAGTVAAVVRGRAVPETAAWSAGSVAGELARRRPDLVVCVT